LVRRLVLGLVALAAVAAFCARVEAQAQAQGAPDRPVRIVVPFPPGGTTDIVTRILAGGAARHLPHGVVVDNKAGAGGNIGTAEVARARPDGATLLQCTIGTCAINPSLYANPGYDLARDFAPVILAAAVRNVMVVRPDLPARTPEEVIALVRGRPDRITFASSGIGASNHLAPELLRGMLGLRWVHVPYRGSAPAITDLVAGRVDVFFDNLPSILPHIRAGAVRPVAAASAERLPELPEVPTFAEAGVPGVVIDSWFGLLAPAGTPAAAVAALNAAFDGALRDPAVRGRLVEAGAVPLGGPPERMGEQVRAEAARWGQVVRANSIRAE
jgi:tripartite-type tricarboxylate transporter receptor subunit TctC